MRNGNVGYIQEKLREKNIECFDWRSLFEKAHNCENIALLPSLSKKIPTFDFAVIFAEAVDTVKMRGTTEIGSMRDNVIFELGLCIMALGIERVILFSEDSIRIPEDLVGVGKIGIEQVTFNSKNKEESVLNISNLIERKSEILAKRLDRQINDIVKHINKKADFISPIFIGASVSSAEAYFMNFIVRFFESVDKGIECLDNAELGIIYPQKTEMKIIIPQTVNMLLREKINEYYVKHKYEKFLIRDAGSRGLFFYGKYLQDENLLQVVDIPTSVTASYSVVSSILSTESDDEYDKTAQDRFVTKEMDMYAYTLKKLLQPELISDRLLFIKENDKRMHITESMKNVSVVIEDISI